MSKNSVRHRPNKSKAAYYYHYYYYSLFKNLSIFFAIFFYSINPIAPTKTVIATEINNSLCPPEWTTFTENKCVRLSSQQSSSLLNYEQAVDYCKSLSSQATLISLANNEAPVLLALLSTHLWKLSKATNKSLITSTTFLTSGLREGSNWLWTNDRVLLDWQPVDIQGGRCVALAFTGDTLNQTRRLQMVSVDCTQSSHLAICQLNLAFDCTPENGQYEGNIETSNSGMPCLHWTDPLVTRTGYFCPQQKLWKHNYCRNLNSSASQSRPWCMVSPTAFQECDVPFCKTAPKMVVAHQTNLQSCAKGELRCGFSAQCVRSEYWCDYEVDCENGFDEATCANYLQHFQIVGQYTLVNEVIEIWTNIPHVQACAKRCLDPPLTTPACESFSYESTKEFCLLSQQTNSPAIIFPKKNSVYYQRNLISETAVVYSMQPATNVVAASKGGIQALVCLDSNIKGGVAAKLCQKAGYGLPISIKNPESQSNFTTQLPTAVNDHWPLLLPLIDVLVAPSPSTSPLSYWTVDCLQSPSCLTPIQSNCLHLLACSTCDKYTQFTCPSTHKCIQNSQLCDKKADCSDGSDESDCAGTFKWFLRGDKLQEGRVQLHLHGELGDVCLDGLQASEPINRICGEIVGATSIGRILPVGQQTPTVFTWHVDCNNSNSIENSVRISACRVVRMSKCSSGLLNLKCQRPELDTCGKQQPAISAKSRVTRIVGGINTRPGQSPWTAALKLKLGKAHHCGAAIITHRFLLTAAHCFQDFKEVDDFFVVTGDWDNGVKEEGEQTHNLTAIHFHPQYNQDLFEHDIAILELADSPGIVYTNVSQPICLPPRNFQYMEGEICTVTGWGSNVTNDDFSKDYPRRMQTARLPILNKENCRNVSKTYAAVGTTSFCAGYLTTGGVDSCQGDSGGPFACEYNGQFYLAGIISWGDGCAQKEHPGIYTMITPYLSWIENITKTDF